jgi:DNA-binding IclR family transcriptional regulator
MSRTEGHGAAWMRPGDEAILQFLADETVEYPAIIANRTGIHTPYVERRCEVLTERGLLERVSGEVVFRITDEGRRRL